MFIIGEGALAQKVADEKLHQTWRANLLTRFI
jgi:hypothetical protein